MPRYTSERIEEIRGHLAKLELGACSVAKLSREIGVSPWTIYCWKRRFSATSAQDRRPVRAARSRADLVEIEQPPACELIEIAVGPMTVRVPGAFDPIELQRVLEVVRAC